jgi:GxxExxY protein
VDERQSAESLNTITGKIIGAAIDVHRVLGPGLSESVYQQTLQDQIQRRGLAVTSQKFVPVLSVEGRPPRGFRIDLLVEDCVVVEIKAVDRLLPLHEAQLRTYLRMAGCPVGLLLNFNVPVLKEGIKRVVNNFPE